MEKSNTFSEFPAVLQQLVRFLNRITSPEGCTAVDARKLREYNHRLADEVEFYKRRVEMLQREQHSAGLSDKLEPMVLRLLVLAIKHTPRKHHDWEEVIRYAKRLDEEKEQNQ